MGWMVCDGRWGVEGEVVGFGEGVRIGGGMVGWG